MLRNRAFSPSHCLNITGLFLWLLLGLLINSQKSFGQEGEPIIDDEQIAAATEVMQRHEDRLFGLPGVIGVGVGLTETEDAVAIHVYVDETADQFEIPVDLEGVPVLVVEVEGGFQSFDTQFKPFPAGAPLHIKKHALPVPLGVSTGPAADKAKGDDCKIRGTIGFRVHRIGDIKDVGYITNNHVAAASGRKCLPTQLEKPNGPPTFGLDQCQPARPDAAGKACRAIGDLIQVIPRIEGRRYLNTVDAAFVKSSRGCVSRKIQDIGVPLKKARFPQLGEIVQKSGATTGHTFGRVTAINCKFTIDASAGNPTFFVNQAVVRAIGAAPRFSQGGDSGSPVVTELNQPVGLLFAGTIGQKPPFMTIINPLPMVLKALGVEIDIAPDDPPSDACTTVTPVPPKKSADLQARKIVAKPTPVKVGDRLEFRIRIKNNGPATATGVKLKVTLVGDATFTFVEASSGCKFDGVRTFNCVLPNLTSNQTITRVIKVRPTMSGSITAGVVVTGKEPDPDPANNNIQKTVKVKY